MTALELADELEWTDNKEAADMLRKLYAENQALKLIAKSAIADAFERIENDATN